MVLKKIGLLLLMLVFVSLQGCFYQSVDKVEIDKGIEMCEEHGGLRSISENFEGYTTFICIDGTDLFEENYKIKPIDKQ